MSPCRSHRSTQSPNARRAEAIRPVGVEHVGEAGQRVRLQQFVVGLLGQRERPLVLARARGKLATREVQRTPQVGDARLLAGQAQPPRDRLGGIEGGEARLGGAGQPVTCGDADQCPAAMGVVVGTRQRAAERGDGSLRVAEVAGEPAGEDLQHEGDGVRAGDARAPLRQAQRHVGVQRLGLRARGVQERLRGPRVLRALEMLGAQHRVAPLVPRRRTPVQCAPGAVQQ